MFVTYMHLAMQLISKGRHIRYVDLFFSNGLVDSLQFSPPFQYGSFSKSGNFFPILISVYAYKTRQRLSNELVAMSIFLIII